MSSPLRTSSCVLALVLGLAAPASADAPSSDRIEDARAAVAIRPADRERRLVLITLLVESRRSADALRELDLYDALAPGDARAEHWRARALLALGRAAEAEDVLRDATAPSSLALRGQLREERGDIAGAGEDYAEATRQAPTIDLDLALQRTLEREGRIEEAILVLEAGVRRTGAAVLRVEAAELARRTGRYERALAQVDALIESTPDATRWRVMRAAILRDAGRSADAQRELRLATSLAERMVERRGTPLSLVERARVRFELGQIDAARLDLQQALRLAPDLLAARRLLASVEASR